jgi:hypothetical protein
MYDTNNLDVQDTPSHSRGRSRQDGETAGPLSRKPRPHTDGPDNDWLDGPAVAQLGTLALKEV